MKITIQPDGRIECEGNEVNLEFLCNLLTKITWSDEQQEETERIEKPEETEPIEKSEIPQTFFAPSLVFLGNPEVCEKFYASTPDPKSATKLLKTLDHLGFRTLNQLELITESELKLFQGIGAASINLLKKILKIYGMKFKD